MNRGIAGTMVLGSQGAHIESQTFLMQLNQIKEHVLEVHEAQRRLELSMESKVAEMTKAVQSLSTVEPIEQALQRCVEKFLGAVWQPAAQHPQQGHRRPSEQHSDHEGRVTPPTHVHNFVSVGDKPLTPMSTSPSGGNLVLAETQDDMPGGPGAEPRPPAAAAPPPGPSPAAAAAKDRAPTASPTDEEVTQQQRDKAAWRRPTMFKARDAADDVADKPWTPGHVGRTPTSGKSFRKGPFWELSPLHPNSIAVHFYDCILFWWMMFEACVIPYQVAFEVRLTQSFFIEIVSYLILAIWSVDLVSGFVIGIYAKGELVMDFGQVAIYYLQRGFIINAITVSVDIVDIIWESTMTRDEPPVLLRLLKISRLVRIFAKIFFSGRSLNLSDKIGSAVRHWGISTQVKAMINLCWVLSVMIYVNHFCACGWRIVGQRLLEYYVNYWEVPEEHRNEYLVAYFNSVSLLLSSQPIAMPSTTGEMVSTIVGIYFGLVFVSVLISAVATHLIDFHIANKEKMDKVKILREYLNQRRVEAKVAIPVEKQVFERLRSVKSLSDKDVGVLNILSPSLRADLQCSVYGGSAQKLPLVAACNFIDDYYIRQLCSVALLPGVYDPGHRVFEPELEAIGAYFLTWGECEYTMPAEDNNAATQNSSGLARGAVKVEGKVWVSEIAIWAMWRHRGTLECAKASELLCFSASSLNQVLRHHPALLTITQDYMKAVDEAMAHEPGEDLSDLTMCVDHEVIINSMPLESRRQLSQAALNALTNGGGRWGRPKRLQKLSEEVANGTCNLIVDSQDQVKRVVNVVALRAVRDDDYILVRIAEKKEDRVNPGLVLPGTKVRNGELPNDAFRRFVDTQLHDFSKNLQVKHREVVSEEKMSSQLGVMTKYMRSVFHAGFSKVDGAAPYEPIGRKQEVTKDSSKSLGGYGTAHSSLSSNYEAFWVEEGKGKASIYAWMDQEEFDSLSRSNQGEAAATTWVNGLCLERSEDTPGDDNI